MKVLDCIVIGGGQAGLSAAYYLKEAGLDYLILDAHHRIGDSRRQRYDSLRLFSPRFCNFLPGQQPMCGSWNNYPSKNEMADYLECYAETQ
ncbi:MAG: NAD(P)-binding domain-containing protein [Candidatus Peribacteria bacterium]|nr:MAG: NAD(P)-binding domain-containing protein [Candidatus Peribacteria bacterium]